LLECWNNEWDFTKGVLEGRGRSEEREREMSVSSNPRFFFLVKDKVRKRGLYFCFSLCGRKEGRVVVQLTQDSVYKVQAI
jgi:hypothetical protein